MPGGDRYRPRMMPQPVTDDDPWGYPNSREWATSCPPPRHNFTSIPRIRSERPAFDLHHPHAAAGRDAAPGRMAQEEAR